MDLISRKALLNDMCEDREEGTFDFTDEQAEAADKILRYVVGRIGAQPSVPAVPLDKLCECLVRKRIGFVDEVDGIRLTGELTKEAWATLILEWMEELDDGKEPV